ncbi:hypothetical protein HPB51_027970 [Rhipicephalus microplus]|uniref:Uncharacterized protein n=1 Tax=Rhipicephalus microplus TaxID=6941 RepID=A0A9J6CYT7_RHIMP|nr:hypothetical protein HPB51_027970 [Rhipicephalus microplus]
MFPQLCPPVPPFQSTYPKVWFMQLDAVLAVNGITDQPLMHAILHYALPVELHHLAATSSTSPQPYDALCTAVLARNGLTYRPLPGARDFGVVTASQRVLPTVAPPDSMTATLPPASEPGTDKLSSKKRIIFVNQYVVCVAENTSPYPGNASTSIEYHVVRRSHGPGQGRTDAPSTGPGPSPRADCGHARELHQSAAVHATKAQSRSMSNLTWAERVRSNEGQQPIQCNPPPEHARDAEILRMKKKNTVLNDMLSKSTNEMAEFKRRLSTMHSNTEGETNDTLVAAPIGDGPMAPKRRVVVSKLKNTEFQVKEIMETLATNTKNIRLVARSVASPTDSVRQMQAALSDPVKGLRAMNEGIIALENHAKLPKSAPHGQSSGEVEMAIPIHLRAQEFITKRGRFFSHTDPAGR